VKDIPEDGRTSASSRPASAA